VVDTGRSRSMSSTSRTPRVSICVPNLNTRPFLPERFETIFAQTFQDWELLAYDSYSDDGAWEYLSDLARREPRMRAWQGPRQGTPGSWNPCIAAARGEFVYVATSDDTMALDFLEKMVAALDAHPDCSLAHCPLRVIDEHGKDIPRLQEAWSEWSYFPRSSGQLRDRPHVRLAPFDGLLHLGGETVYRSITQLLIRRSLFESIGMFESTWGSVGDFDWEMRAGLVANTVHVPHTWGGWRIHESQATASASFGSEEHGQKIDSMIDHAVATCRSKLEPQFTRHLSSWVARAKDLRKFNRELVRHLDDTMARRRFIVAQLVTGSAAARAHVLCKLSGRVPDEFHERLRNWLEDAGIQPLLVPSSPLVAEDEVAGRSGHAAWRERSS
jgi:glycosyltransferase involved in cell wall biosynthesis